MSPLANITFHAHTTDSSDQSNWEPLFTPYGKADANDPIISCSGKNAHPCPHCENLKPTHGHLNKVAHLAAKLAGDTLPENHPDHEPLIQWAYLTGLWHDLGKFSPEWQTYLSTKADTHQSEATGSPKRKEDHTTAGAKHAVTTSPLGHLIATAIAGHHAGLLDARATGASLENRLRKTFGNEIPHITAPSEITDTPIPPLPSFLSKSAQEKDADFTLAFFQRLLFSCLVDADFLATESFMNPAQADLRPTQSEDTFTRALQLLIAKIERFGTPDPDDKVATARATVVNDCTNAAAQPPGIFTLTVPTGGGKTLSSLNFALRHALAHDKKRIIYVIPFTSIIEQNASVFRDLLAPLGENTIIEHHSNLSPETENQQTETSRLAAENWDAPIIVTTAVQFYESLFAAKTSRCRKLHNIANAVVILDEAQCLPTQYLDPCLRVLRELSENYHTTTVLCTATQPAVAKSDDFPIGFPGSTEIIQNTQQLFADLNRVNVTYRGQLPDQTIASELADAPQALCIVNTRKHARTLYELLPENPEENYHLSTLMCPQHRLRVLTTVRQRLKENLPVRLISTQLIEAGVDVDFPLVYRSMAGLDSIAQASGRCNREGKLRQGQVHVFLPEQKETHLAASASIGHEFLDLHTDDPLGTAAVRGYFNKYYYQNKSQWDAKNILADFQYTGAKNLPLLAQYRTAADKFRLIENTQIPIIIPWNDKAKQLCKDLRNDSIPLHRQLLRALQRYTVQIYETEFHKNHHQFESLRDDQFHLLICPETHYSDQFGLNLTSEAPNTQTLIC